MTFSETISKLLYGLPSWIVAVPIHSETRIPLERWKTVTSPELAQAKWRGADRPILTEARFQGIRGFDLGVAILTGPSGLTVLDLDTKHGIDGFEKCAEWISSHAKCSLDEARREISDHPVRAESPSAGGHLYYLNTVELDSLTTTFARPQDTAMDVRGTGGLIVAPPTRSIAGREYRWVTCDWSRIEKAPDWLVAYVKAHAGRKKKRASGAGRKLRVVGSRVLTGKELDPQTLFETEDGATGTAEDLLRNSNQPDGKATVRCVHPQNHQNADSTASAVLFPGDPPGFYCSACDQHQFIGSPGRGSFGGVKVNVTVEDEAEAEDLEDLFSGEVKKVEGNRRTVHRLNERYLGDLSRFGIRVPEAGQVVVHLRAPMDGGKSYSVVSMIKECRKTNPRARVLLPPPRVSLVEKWLTDLREVDCKDYRLSEGLFIEAEGVVACCLDSIWKLEQPKDGWDIVFVDEVTMALEHLISHTMKRPERVIRSLRSILRGAKLIVCADANHDEWTIRKIRTILGWDSDSVQQGSSEILIDNRYQVHKNRRGAVCFFGEEQALQRFYSEWEWEHKQEDTWVVSVSSKKQLKTLIAGCLRRNPGARILPVSQDHQIDPDFREQVRGFLIDPDGQVGKYDLVLYTGTLGTGFSIHTVVGRQWGFLSAGTHATVNSALQSMHRFRNIADPIVRVWVDDRPAPGETDEERHHSLSLMLRTSDLRRAVLAGGVEVAYQDANVIPFDPEAFRLLSDLECRRVQGRKRFRAGVVEGFLQQGYRVKCQDDSLDDVTKKFVRAEVKGDLERIEDHETDRRWFAPVVDVTTAEAILQNPGKGDFYSAQHTIFADRLGEDSRPAVHEALHKKALKKAGLLADVLCEPEVVARLDVEAFKVNSARRNFRFLRSLLIRRLLADFGLKVVAPTSVGPDSPFKLIGDSRGQAVDLVVPSVECLHSWLTLAPIWKRATGWAVPMNMAQNSTAWLASVLRHLGLRLERRRTRGSCGTRIRNCAFDPLEDANHQFLGWANHIANELAEIAQNYGFADNAEAYLEIDWIGVVSPLDDVASVETIEVLTTEGESVLVDMAKLRRSAFLESLVKILASIERDSTIRLDPAIVPSVFIDRILGCRVADHSPNPT